MQFYQRSYPNPDTDSIPTNKHHENLYSIWSFILIAVIPVVLISLLLFVSGINLGTIYDCSKLSPQGIYKLTIIPACNHGMHNLNDTVKWFTADIYTYRPTVTKFKYTFVKQPKSLYIVKQILLVLIQKVMREVQSRMLVQVQEILFIIYLVVSEV